MPSINISQIVVLPNRQRTEFDPETIESLRNSIESKGLLHAPVLRTPTAVDREQHPTIQFDGKMVLSAGGTRLHVLTEILQLRGWFMHGEQRYDSGRIPYTDLGSLSELEENLCRKDLSWTDLAAAHQRLHDRRQKQKTAAHIEAMKTMGPAPEPAPGFKPVQTVADTAKEVFGSSEGHYHDTIRKELIVAKHLDNPAVAGAKSLKEAFKILKKEEERQQNVAMALEVGKTFDADKHTIVNANCLQWMIDHLQNDGERFDVICTDPPYGMGADEFGDAGGKMSGITHTYDDSYESWVTLMKEWTKLSFNIAKEKAHAYVFCDFDRFHELKAMMELAGWEVFRTPLVVHKRNSGRVPLPERGPRRQYELVLFANKGRMPCTNIYPDVISVEADENTGHGAQKPVALYQNLLQRSVRPGMRVADFFAGSGPLVEAAHAMHCYATLIEQAADSYGKCLKRAKQLKAMETPALF